MDFIFNLIKSLFDFDTRTLIGVLVWGNAAVTCVVWTFRSHYELTTDVDKIKRLTLVRAAYSIGYLLLFFRGILPDILSVNFGNTILYICFYMEARLLLAIQEKHSKVIDTILKIILILSILLFNITEFIFKDSSIRITIASGIIFALMLTPTIKLIFFKQTSKFKHIIGIFYSILLISLIPRIIMPLITRDINLHTNTAYQTLFFNAQILMMVLSTIIYLLFMKENSDKIIEKLAKTDGLTNISNRHNFLAEAEEIFALYKTLGKEITILFFDLDYFKTINDSYGHQFGDEVLKSFTEVLQRCLRSEDIFCRYGGEEFVVMLRGQNSDIGKLIAERIKSEIEKLIFKEVADFKFTVSIGIASGVPGEQDSLAEFIRKSDLAMYKAKKTGRNNIVIYNKNLDCLENSLTN